MGKGTELWDDSALTRAFDAAMASYKEMHGECLSGFAIGKEKDESNSEESDTVLTEEAKSGRKIESVGNNFDVDSNMKEACAASCNNSAAASDPFTQENDIGANCPVSEFNPLISDRPYVDPKIDGTFVHQNLNCNELLKQYYELEQRKEKIVEQLWKANYWNYQTPDQCPTSQHQQVPMSSGSELGPNTSCPWCTCQRFANLSSISNCPMASALSAAYACCPQQSSCCSGSQVQQEAVQEDDSAVEKGVMPVEILRNPVKEDLSRAFNLEEEKKKGEDDGSGIFKGKELSSTKPKTDLTSVLNAWYWAGYQTGRYLLEQEQSDRL